jgi:DNA-binding transcriptional LysR family regulator
MNLADLHAFVAVVETGSVNRAAARLGLTQPATTRRVQNFEASLGGTPLLDRSVKPPVLTVAGRQVLAHCQRVLRAVSDLESSVAATAEPIGDLRIGISPGLAETVLSSPLDALRSRFPRLQLSVSALWTSALIADVADCGLDCAIALATDRHALPPRVTGTTIGTEAVVVVAARDAEIPQRGERPLRLSHLAHLGWVLNPPGCGYREALQRACDRAEVPCRMVAEILGYDIQLSLVARGAGLGLVPQGRFKRSPLRRRLRVLPVADFALEARIAVLRGASIGRLGVAVDHLQARLQRNLKK